MSTYLPTDVGMKYSYKLERARRLEQSQCCVPCLPSLTLFFWQELIYLPGVNQQKDDETVKMCKVKY